MEVGGCMVLACVCHTETTEIDPSKKSWKMILRNQWLYFSYFITGVYASSCDVRWNMQCLCKKALLLYIGEYTVCFTSPLPLIDLGLGSLFLFLSDGLLLLLPQSQ